MNKKTYFLGMISICLILVNIGLNTMGFEIPQPLNSTPCDQRDMLQIDELDEGTGVRTIIWAYDCWPDGTFDPCLKGHTITIWYPGQYDPERWDNLMIAETCTGGESY